SQSPAHDKQLLSKIVIFSTFHPANRPLTPTRHRGFRGRITYAPLKRLIEKPLNGSTLRV
ncbi:MAG: hypothetical protein WCI46_07090, partial [Verrucomicrobiota bacterium]